MVRCWSISLLFCVVLLSSLGFAGTAYADTDSDELEQDLSEPRFAAGIYGLYGVSRQGGKSFTTSDSVDYQTNGYNGQIFEPGVFFDFHRSPRWAYRFFLGYQMVQYSGQASEVGIPVAPQGISLNENLLTFGIEARFVPSENLGLWLGFGFELIHGLNMTLSLGGISVPTFSDDEPNLVQVLTSVGYDFKFMENWLIGPELRVSDAFSTNPSILSFQGIVSLGRRF